MLPLLSAIPAPIKQQIADTLVDFLARQADRFAGDKIAGQATTTGHVLVS